MTWSAAVIASCDATTAPAQVTSSFYHVGAFTGTGYYSNATISRSAFLRPFPQFTSITENNLPLVHSWYNALQVTASHNVARNLSLHFAYTWSKNMQAGNIIDTVNRVYGRNLMANDVPTAITFSGVYYLPFGRGRTFFGHTNRLVDAAIGGFELSPYYVYTGGVPWVPGNNFELANSLYLKQHDLPIDSTHIYKRLQGASPCVGYQDSDTPGLIHPGPTYTSSGCTSYSVVRQEATRVPASRQTTPYFGTSSTQACACRRSISSTPACRRGSPTMSGSTCSSGWTCSIC